MSREGRHNLQNGSFRETVPSTKEQAEIGVFMDAGLTSRAIARQIGRSHRCINRYLQNPHSYRSAPVSRRPRVLLSQNHRRNARMELNSMWAVNQIRSKTSLTFSRATIWRFIRPNQKIKRQAMQKAPHLTEFHKQD
ncbi:hypothetical protein NECAME_12168 [Necator americanus]|uniref:Tc3 transposase DNA binding domain-containing protein n=1 Tax=Necator americanus TaxID=51031 RepID=W2T1F3_NECAM|nr:hypothetical protein NECAME_12168 [Necator americanus]ETN75738.1 hypothetical protein NECAME_12168 [Necator americanus]